MPARARPGPTRDPRVSSRSGLLVFAGTDTQPSRRDPPVAKKHDSTAHHRTPTPSGVRAGMLGRALANRRLSE
eukprot:3806290-Prymnesium_polylepis.1